MRKWQQKQILAIIDSLQQIHLEIQKKYILRDDEGLLTLLTECQECAIETGNAIEESEGLGCQSVQNLEIYCENLYQTSQLIHEERNYINGDNIYKTLSESLLQVKKGILDVMVKKEVVFFPYKASMWDSLESVYLAAREDNTCDAYCVPIPYFDKNPDGSFREMQYEGDEYPNNIEITDWESYHFEERHPDVIYIHNPYDEWNFVTSVHPRFYASNLKQYTDKLVYIPYFVLPDIDPNDQVAVEGMKHFCYLPGTVYADKVILQSEDMRQIYMNEFIKAVEAHGEKIDRSTLEERFLGLGSPKLDKTDGRRRESIDIPNTWKDIILDEKGDWKKIILYNVTVTGLLQEEDRMIEKMKHVFSTFKENRKEIALWWRPHPLIEATIASMRPQLWKQYQELVNEYKRDAWGIYDDTTDIHRAIDISDAYYGDLSSVVPMYQETGKPVMIQNVDVWE